MADGRHEAGTDRMLEILTIMSDNEHDHPLIRNEDTLRRRAWIDRALAGVRKQLRPAELGEPPTAPEPAPADLVEPAADGGRPKLYLIRNSDSR